MLNGPRAVIVAAVLIAAAIVGRELVPRFDVLSTNEGATVTRIDRWTGRTEVVYPRGSASWLQRRTDTTAADTSTPTTSRPVYQPERRTWTDAIPLASLALIAVAVWKGPSAYGRIRRRGPRAGQPTPAAR